MIIMQNLKRYIIDMLPHNRYMLVLSSIYDFMRTLAWKNTREYQRSMGTLKKLKNKYSGKRCYIIGNGPSINKIDLKKLKGEYTFALNRGYLLFPKLGFDASFLVCINPLVIKQFSDEMQNNRCLRFLNQSHADHFDRKDSNNIFINSCVTPGFSESPQEKMWEGATVTYIALQLAYYFGFKEVVLIGVDHNFKTKGKAHQEVAAEKTDVNHFDPNYFSSGIKWNLPDLKTSEVAYRLAKEHFESSNRVIYDATYNGKLKIFPKIKYKDALINKG
jgi:hypothetical protein